MIFGELKSSGCDGMWILVVGMTEINQVESLATLKYYVLSLVHNSPSASVSEYMATYHMPPTS